MKTKDVDDDITGGVFQAISGMLIDILAGVAREIWYFDHHLLRLRQLEVSGQVAIGLRILFGYPN